MIHRMVDRIVVRALLANPIWTAFVLGILAGAVSVGLLWWGW